MGTRLPALEVDALSLRQEHPLLVFRAAADTREAMSEFGIHRAVSLAAARPGSHVLSASVLEGLDAVAAVAALSAPGAWIREGRPNALPFLVRQRALDGSAPPDDNVDPSTLVWPPHADAFPRDVAGLLPILPVAPTRRGGAAVAAFRPPSWPVVRTTLVQSVQGAADTGPSAAEVPAPALAPLPSAPWLDEVDRCGTTDLLVHPACGPSLGTRSPVLLAAALLVGVGIIGVGVVGTAGRRPRIGKPHPD